MSPFTPGDKGDFTRNTPNALSDFALGRSGHSLKIKPLYEIMEVRKNPTHIGITISKRGMCRKLLSEVHQWRTIYEKDNVR